MKSFLKKLIVFIGIIGAISTTINLTTPSSASAFSCRYILGMTSWDCNVTDINSQESLTSNMVQIATNILSDVSVLASYLVIGYVMWGGYLYMFSSGDPGKAAAGKKTLLHAFIGLAICISAYTIFSAIRIALTGGKDMGSCANLASSCVTPDRMVVNLIQWVAGVAGVVSAIFLVVGGWGYITAAGDPGKLQKAKSTILYALIGLGIVAAAQVITAFVSSTIRNANDSALIPTTTIAKTINKETT